MNVNKAIIVGRLTKEPDARTTPNGKSVTSLSIATNKVWNDESGNKQEKTDFHDIILWGKVAEIAAQYLVKGQEVYIEGRIETRNWEGKDGIKRYKTEIVVSGMDGRLQMGSRPQGASQSQSVQGAPAQRTQAAQPGGNNYRTNQSAPSSADQEEEIKIEDIPF